MARPEPHDSLGSTPSLPPTGSAAEPATLRSVFRDVDADEGDELVAMMDATDAWPAVRAARAWVLGAIGLDAAHNDRSPQPDDEAPATLSALGAASALARPAVVDVGCGPGTFGALARSRGARTVEVDPSDVMLATVRRRHAEATVVCASLPHLPLVAGSADVVRVERVLQWTTDPDAGLAELVRVVGPTGTVAITDTDWSTLAVDHPDAAAAGRLRAAALRWVPHPTLAPTLPDRLRSLGAGRVETRTDVMVLDAWDPDDPAQADGPPGLPVRIIAAAGGGPAGDVDALADQARAGRFAAELTLVTVVASLDA